MNCQNETNECLSTPCKNNAECIDLVANFECKCKPGYFGRLCQIDINECMDLPCANGATCLDKVNDYQCVCVPGRFISLSLLYLCFTNFHIFVRHSFVEAGSFMVKN